MNGVIEIGYVVALVHVHQQSQPNQARGQSSLFSFLSVASLPSEIRTDDISLVVRAFALSIRF